MKRSDFFKSLAGIAVAPIVGVKVLSEIKDTSEWPATIDSLPRELPFYPQGAISTGWISAPFEDNRPRFHEDTYDL